MEAYLIEELAVLAFRKQRLYQAEDALIVEKMQMSSSHFLKKSANLLMQEEDMDDLYETDRVDLKPILYFQPENYEGWSLEEQKHYLAKVQKVVDSDLTYEEMLTHCPKAALEIWNGWRSHQEEDRNPDAESLREFLRENIIEWCQQDSRESQARPYLKKQAVGMAYAPNDKMEKLQRYETSMDRAFERKLGMLLKLREVRNTSVSEGKPSICLEKGGFS